MSGLGSLGFQISRSWFQVEASGFQIEGFGLLKRTWIHAGYSRTTPHNQPRHLPSRPNAGLLKKA